MSLWFERTLGRMPLAKITASIIALASLYLSWHFKQM